MKKTTYENIFPAIAIPLNDDYSVNEKELRSYAKWLAGCDEINGLVANGHTGEITSFNREERKNITRILAEEVGDKVAVISGICCEGTLEAIDHARDAQKAGADGILLMPPHLWLRFGMNPRSPVEFTRDVAAAIDIDIIMHLYPHGTKAFYPMETLLELAKIPNVKAFKIGTRQMALYEKHVRTVRKEAPHIKLLTCQDEYLLSSMYVGVDGALVGFGGCIPELIGDAWKAVKANDFKRTRELQDKIFQMADAIYGIGQPSGEAHARLKEVLEQRGIFTSALMRKPVLPLTEEEIKNVERVLKYAGLMS